MLGIDHDPVEITGGDGPRRWPPARIPDETIAVERADELILLVPVQGFIQQLDRGRDLLLAEEAGGPRQLVKPSAVRAPDGAQRAAHARPSFPAPPAARSPRCGGSARRTPNPRPSPSGTDRRHR